jgi:hypothetical protein
MPGAPRQETNVPAILSLIFGVLGAVLISVIFGLVALSQIAKRGERGRGLAIAGLSISAAWVAVIVAAAAIISFITVDTRADNPPASLPTATADVQTERTSGPGRRPSVFLQLGDCLSYVDELSDPEDLTVELCSQQHGGEVYDIWSLPSGAFPGDAKVEKQAREHCEKALKRYAIGKFADAKPFYIFPSRESWSQGRRVVCIAVPSGKQWTGSMVHP